MIVSLTESKYSQSQYFKNLIIQGFSLTRVILSVHQHKQEQK